MRIKNIAYSLSIVLSITLVGGLIPTKIANAASLSYAMKPSILTNKVLTREETSQIESGIDVLNNCHIDTSIIKRVNVTASGNEYILKYKNNDEKVIIKNSDTESVTIIASDGKKSNVISFAKDGSIILDGFKVQVSKAVQMNRNVAVIPNMPIYKSVKSLYPYGGLKSSDYYQYLTTGKQNIALGKAINAITVTVLGIMIGSLCTYSGILVTLAGVASNVKDILVAANPTTQYLGCEFTTYTAGSDDYQYYNRFYANTECTGTYSLQISYEHFTVY